MKAELFDVSVRALAAGGAGVADLPDGRVAFVQRTAPGDRARVRLRKSRRRWAEASVERLLQASDARVEPPCPQYAGCGGCRLQHLPIEVQRRWKGRFVADALERIGGLGTVEPPEVGASPDAFGYRSRMTFTLRRLRDGRVVAGLHALGRPAHVVDVPDCLLAVGAVREAWGALREAWGPGARLLPAGGRLRLGLRATDAGVELRVEGGTPGWDAEPVLRAVEALSAVWHHPDGVEAAAGSGEPVAGTSSAGGGVAFEQVNRRAADLLRAHVLRRIEEAEPDAGRAIDAYCGTGAYGRTLAERGWQVVGIEVDEAAVQAARSGAPGGFDVRRAEVGAALGGAFPADLLVVNPPRGGLEDGVVERVLEGAPRTVVYVSCDPGTLARDLGGLSSAYRLADLSAFDLFPQTAHVESVAVLTRAAEGEA